MLVCDVIQEWYTINMMCTFISQAMTASRQQEDDSVTEAEQNNEGPKMSKQQMPALLN